MTRLQGIIALLTGVLWVAGAGFVVHQHDLQQLGRSEKQSAQERQRLLQRITELEADLVVERRVNDDLQIRLLRAAERERAAKIRASRSRRATALPAVAWAHQPFSIRVANCESGGGPSDHSTIYDGNPHLRDPNGHDGKWQFAPATWWSVGGIGNAADASEAEQDYRAWLLWKRDGWGPWTCHTMV